MKTWLAFGLLLVGCAGQPHPNSPSEVVECRFELVADVVHAIPDDVLFAAVMGDVDRLPPYLLKVLSPADVVELVNAWKACAPEVKPPGSG